MSRDREYLLDIVEAAKLAVSYLAGKSREGFLHDTQCQDAVIRRLEIIGEAARRVSDETKDRLPGVPWSAMVGMRNVITHQYDDIDLGIVWNTVANDLAAVMDAIAKGLTSGQGA
jgi:uncharacterized protein with HEPN domain